MTEKMLVFEGVTKIFNQGTQDEKRALNQIDLKVNAGDFITIIGSNGAGKSTLLNVIAGTHQPEEGRLIINRKDVTKTPDYKMAAYISRVFQSPTMGTAGEMTIAENLSLADCRGKRRGLKWGVTRARKKRFRELLKMLELGLEDRLNQSVGLLSGGQRQSLTLLMATLSLPKLLLLDEHTAALDPRTAAKVSELTDRMIEENHLTALMVTHNMKQAIACGNRMIMLHEGKVRFDVRGKEKENLTVESVVRRFGATLKDESLLS